MTTTWPSIPMLLPTTDLLTKCIGSLSPCCRPAIYRCLSLKGVNNAIQAWPFEGVVFGEVSLMYSLNAYLIPYHSIPPDDIGHRCRTVESILYCSYMCKKLLSITIEVWCFFSSGQRGIHACMNAESPISSMESWRITKWKSTLLLLHLNCSS